MPPLYTNYLSCVKMHEILLLISISRLRSRINTRRTVEHRQQVSHRVVRLDGVTEWGIDHDRVRVASALSLTSDAPRLDQIRHDRLGCTLGDANGGGDIASPDRWITVDAHEHVGMVAQKRPLTPAGLGVRVVVRHVCSHHQYTNPTSQDS